MTPFDAASEALSRATGMTPAQARGTLRLVVKARGLSTGVARGPLLQVIERDLARELQKRRLPAGPEVLEALRRAVESSQDDDDLAYDLFRDID